MSYIKGNRFFYTLFLLILIVFLGPLQTEGANYGQINYYNSPSYNKNLLHYQPNKINLGLGGGVSPRNLISATVYTEVRGYFTQKTSCRNCSYPYAQERDGKSSIPFLLRTTISNYRWSQGNSLEISFRSWGLSGFFTVNYGYGIGLLDIVKGKQVKPALNFPLGFQLRFSDNLGIESELKYSLIFHKPTDENFSLNFSIFFPIFKY